MVAMASMGELIALLSFHHLGRGPWLCMHILLE